MKDVKEFLQDLKQNNNKEWFDENRSKYEAARKTVESLATELINEVSIFDPDMIGLAGKDVVFRIFRDVRFSLDKTPYKTHFGIFIAKGGKNAGNAGYYLHLDPDETFIGAGCHLPQTEALKKIRDAIDYDATVILNYLNDPILSKKYKLDDISLKKAPKGYEEYHENIALLKLKSHTIGTEALKIAWDKENIKKITIEIFRDLSEYVKYFNIALTR